ncbi:hypothetical protein BFS30_24755 [Pedobacter steynii]|uniref:Immunoglobulin domain-containing protein n=2 Tax=Pedobacter steynii TaxID=430522 RepID=A0A1D7QN45_9SPHI|nr:hypothetical protein BFS30_24755 [Pedobacter steynii]
MFLLFALSLPVFLNAQNLVQNGTFTQQPPVSWTFAPPGTSVEANNPETTYGGVVTANIVAELDMEASLRQTNIAVTPGQPYYISYRYSRRTGNGSAPNPSNFNVKIYEGAINFLSRNEVANNTTWQWTCVVDSFIPTTNMVTVDMASTNLTASLGVLVDDITITPIQQPVTLTGQICAGGTLTLNAPASNPNSLYTNYQWTGPNGFTASGPNVTLTNVQPGQNGTYIFTANLNTECLQVTGSYLLEVLPTEFIINKTICKGDSYTFYGQTLFSAGTYDTVISGNALACDSSITLNLNVIPLPDMATMPPDASLCVGDSIWLRVNNPDANVSYQWYKESTALNGETGGSILAKDAGVYTVVGITGGCSDTSRKIVVTIHPLPQAKIHLSEAEVPCSFDTVMLEAEGGQGYNYIWYPCSYFMLTTGAGSRVVRGIFPKLHTPVSLQVFNEYGCQATDSIIVITKPCCETFVPNAFSPNHDALNDYWLPKLQPAQILLTAKIFDRWGNLVYNNLRPSKGWDGTYDGKEAAAGVYMYYLKYTCSDQKIYEKKGDLTLIR